MKIITFDLETTGFPKVIGFDTYYPPEQIRYYETSRVVQIAMMVFDNKAQKSLEMEGPTQEKLGKILEKKKFKLIKKFNFIIKPDKFIVRNSDIHGITQEIAEQQGIPFVDAIKEISAEFKDSSVKIAHNIIFDENVLASELHRYGLQSEMSDFLKVPSFCTSKNTTSITKLKYSKRFKKYKQPKLIELYKFLFDENVDGLHNADQDTTVLSMCFFELLNKELIYFKCI